LNQSSEARAMTKHKNMVSSLHAHNKQPFSGG